MSDILNEAKRYRLTAKGIEAISHMEASYSRVAYLIESCANGVKMHKTKES